MLKLKLNLNIRYVFMSFGKSKLLPLVGGAATIWLRLNSPYEVGNMFVSAYVFNFKGYLACFHKSNLDIEDK